MPCTGSAKQPKGSDGQPDTSHAPSSAPNLNLSQARESLLIALFQTRDPQPLNRAATQVKRLALARFIQVEHKLDAVGEQHVGVLPARIVWKIGLKVETQLIGNNRLAKLNLQPGILPAGDTPARMRPAPMELGRNNAVDGVACNKLGFPGTTFVVA